MNRILNDSLHHLRNLRLPGTPASEADPVENGWRFWFVKNTYFDFKNRLRFYRILLDASAAGISVTERLRQVYGRLLKKNKPQRLLYQILLQRLDAGAPLNRALAGLAPLRERLLIAAGEEKNNITEALQNLIWLMEKTDETQRRVAGALGNIVLQILLLAGVVAGISLYIAPDVQKALDPDAWTEVTRNFFQFTDFLASGGWMVAPAILAAVALAWRHTPLFYLYRLGNTSYLLIALNSLVSAGVSLNEALNQVARAANGYVRKHALLMIANLSAGQSEGEAMNTGMLPQSIAEDLADFSSARGFSNALESLGRMAHERFMRTLDIFVNAVNVIVKILIALYILWFLSAIGTAGMNAFSAVRPY